MIETNEERPPYSLTLEQAIISALISDAGSAYDMISDVIAEVDFYSSRHRALFHHICVMVKLGLPVDALTLLDRLRNHGDEGKVGGEAYLAEIIRNSPASTVNTAAYAARVREFSIQRGLLAASERIGGLVSTDGMSTDDMLAEAEKIILAISDSGPKSNDMPAHTPLTMIEGVIERIDKASNRKPGDVSGVKSGITGIDSMTDGFQPGDLIIIAARPSMGKTTLAMNFAESAMHGQYPAVVFSMEQPEAQITDRLVSAMSGVPLNIIKRGEMEPLHFQRIHAAMSRLKDSKLVVCDKGGLTPEKMGAFLRRIKREYGGVSLIMADYLQKMHATGYGDNRNREIGACSSAAKELAKDYNCPFLMLSQLSKRCEMRPNKRPMMSDLRDSGEIEQDADVIMMLYRDEVYNQDSDAKGVAEIILTKSRNGEIGTVFSSYSGSTFRFSDLATGFEGGARNGR